MPLSRRELIVGCSAAALVACAPSHRRNGSGAPASDASTEPATPDGSQTPSAVGTTTTGGVSGPSRYVQHGPRQATAAALTFHASGDRSLSVAMLDALRSSATPVTVFAVGTWVEANPDLAQRLLDDGHEVANHTYSHPTLGRLLRPAVADEIAHCSRVLQAKVGAAGAWFRPSGTDVPTSLMLDEAGRAGYQVTVGYDVDPHDYQDPGASLVAQRVVSGLVGGAIVSLHFGHRGTVDAMASIVSGAADKRLALVQLSRLIGPDGRDGAAGSGGA